MPNPNSIKLSAQVRRELFHTASNDGWQKVGAYSVKDHGECMSAISPMDNGQHHLVVMKKGMGQIHSALHPTMDEAKATADKVVQGQATMYDSAPDVPPTNL